MKTRQVLAVRLKDCMAKRPDLDTQVKVAAAAKVTQSTVGRCLRASNSASLDIVDSLAKAFGVPVLELLALPQERQLLELWRKLSEEDRYRAMAFMEVSSRSKAGEHAYPPPLQWENRTPISADLGAAVQRASERRPRETQLSKDAKPHDTSSSKRRSK